LKPQRHPAAQHPTAIAPITGARIETVGDALAVCLRHIAPITGARIETISQNTVARRSAHRPHHGGAD